VAKKIAIESEVKAEPKQAESFEIIKLKMLTDGLFKYECQSVHELDRDIFTSETARKYGVRKGNIVMIHDQDEVKSILVG